MAKNNMTSLLIIGVIAYLVFGQGGTDNGTTPTGTTPTGTTLGCAYAPQFELQAADKWDSDVNIGVGHKYILDGGRPQTYSSATEFSRGDSLKVMWGEANATVYNMVDTYTLDWCGKKPIKKSGMVQNTSMTIECFNDENSLITGTTNLTLGSGESWTTDCRMRLAEDQKGLPHGGVLVVELASGTVYEEEKTAVTGGVIGAEVSVPSAYTVAAAANKAVAYEVKPITSTGNNGFDVYFKAETGQDPANTNDLTLKLYSKDCFENSETDDFECGIEDEDNNFAGDLVGSMTLAVD